MSLSIQIRKSWIYAALLVSVTLNLTLVTNSYLREKSDKGKAGAYSAGDSENDIDLRLYSGAAINVSSEDIKELPFEVPSDLAESKPAEPSTEPEPIIQTPPTKGSKSKQCALGLSPVASCSESFANYHSQRLTHVVMPFHTSQVNRVEANLKLWSEFLPCSTGLAATPDAVPNNKFHLVLYSSTDSKKKNVIADVESRMAAAMAVLPPAAANCFATWEVQHANLSGQNDSYYKGTRLMIDKLITGKVKLLKSPAPQYAFYMEPDCLPIRSNWLNALDNSVRWPHEPMWMKGSIYRGYNRLVFATKSPPQLFHINGNAIYNLGDRSFRKFFVDNYKPFALTASQGRDRSFDTDFFRFMHDIDNVMISRNYFHKFQYTDLIQNFWKSSYSASKIRDSHPGTYLVHGGYQKP